MRSILNRDQEHKRIKDLADIYALSWYSGVRIDELRNGLEAIVSKSQRQLLLKKINSSDFTKAAAATSVNLTEIRQVVSQIMS
jgi:hypothetical protein